MSLNPNGAPAGFYYQAGATAYLIDPVGTYSLAGASAPTIDPAGAYSFAGPSAPTFAAAGAYIPITGATSVAAEIVDPAASYSLAGASLPTTDPAGADGGPGASSPTLAAAGASIPITGATSVAAEIVDPAGAYSPAAATTRTTDPAGTDGGASAPALAAAGASIPITGATSAAAEIVGPAGTDGGPSAPTIDLAGRRSAAGVSAPTFAAPGTYIPVAGATSSAAENVDPAGAYSLAGVSAAMIDPAGRRSAAGVSAPTLAAPGARIPATEATSAAAKIVSPPGTYLPPGATAPISDPGGTYSAAGASAPTTDPAGTYSSPYALNRLFIELKNTTPANTVLSFTAQRRWRITMAARVAKPPWRRNSLPAMRGTSATMLFTRMGLGQRPHLLGANISNLTLPELQSISGSLAITFDGYTYSGPINLSGVTRFSDVAGKIESSPQLQFAGRGRDGGSSIAPESVSFTGYGQWSISSRHVGLVRHALKSAALISGHGIEPGVEIVNQLSGTPGGPGEYVLFTGPGTVSSETMTETYGVLTVGAVNSGTVAVGQQVTGAGVLPLTAIVGNLSGSGPGSTWLVDNARNGRGRPHNDGASPPSPETSPSLAQPKIATFSMSSRMAPSASITIHRP